MIARYRTMSLWIVLEICGCGAPSLDGQDGQPLTAAAFVQVAASTPQTPQNTVVASFPSAQRAGDLNIVVVGWNDTTSSVTAVRDDRGNSYALVVGPTRGTGVSQSIYYARDIAPGSNQVTVTFTAAAVYPDIRILEYSGLDPGSPLDRTAAAAGSDASPTPGAVTTSVPNELVFAAGTTSGSFVAAGAGFTRGSSPLRTMTSPKTSKRALLDPTAPPGRPRARPAG
jgi:hypothetical protein